jgi:cardiolipin synthase
MIWPWLATAAVVWWAEAVAVLAAEHRRPERAAAWLLVVLALPIVGIIPFLLVRGKAGDDLGPTAGGKNRGGDNGPIAGRSSVGGAGETIAFAGAGDDGPAANGKTGAGAGGPIAIGKTVGGDDGPFAIGKADGGDDGPISGGSSFGGAGEPIAIGKTVGEDDGPAANGKTGAGAGGPIAIGKIGGGAGVDPMQSCRSTAADGEIPGDERLGRALRAMSKAPITCCNGTEILTDGEAAFRVIFEMIGRAEHHIHLAYYILRDDGVGRRFRDALIRKAREGVQVRLLYDGFGSRKLHRSYLRDLEAAGVRTQCFLPLGAALLSRRINHRYHRKIIVVDGKFGFTGGLNIGDEYLGFDKKNGFWRDTQLRLEGDAVYDLQHIFVRDWKLASGETLDDPALWPPHACASREGVQIVSCGPRPGANEIYDGLLAAIGAARKRVWIATPYFVPDEGLKSALRTAALGGVDVRLIVPGVSDSRFVLAATLSHAADLAAAGVKVYRYRKGFIHAKVMIIDRLLASVGTANLDMRSFYSNYELNALLFDGKPIRRLEEDYLKDLADSREVAAEELRGLTAGARAGRALARLLSPLL